MSMLRSKACLGTAYAELGAGITWTNPPHFLTSDPAEVASVALAAGQVSTFIDVTGPLTNRLPPGAIVRGIGAAVRRQASGIDMADGTVQLVYGGALIGANQASVTDIGTSWHTATTGGCGNLWGATLTPQKVRSATFGVRFGVNNNAGKARTLTVNWEMVHVYWSPRVISGRPDRHITGVNSVVRVGPRH